METVDYQQLEAKFGLCRTPRTDAILTASIEALLTESGAKAFLQDYADFLKATDTTAAAAYTCANVANLALALHYSLALWNRSLHWEKPKLIIQLYRDAHSYIRFAFYIPSLQEEEGPSCDTDRAVWRDAFLTAFYGGTVRPLFESLSSHSGLDAGQLWGQLPTRFNYYIHLYQNELEQASANASDLAEATFYERAHDRWSEDYRAFSKDWDGSAFGRSKNPLDVKIRYLQDLRDPGKQIRMKNTCCLYYKTGEGAYCYTCPRLKPDEREELKAKLLSASAH